MNVSLVLFLVALVLAVIELVRSKGQSLTLWAVVCLALGLTWRLF
jgi:hypothetical protein